MNDDRDNLLYRCYESLSWMVDDMKWRFDLTKSCFEKENEGGYSPELTKAMALRKELEEHFKQGSENGKTGTTERRQACQS